MHTTVWLGLLGFSTGALASPPVRSRVTFEAPSPLRDADPDEARVLARIVTVAEAWLDGDPAAYSAQLAPSAARMGEESGAILRGRDAVVQGMKTDRSQFEQPTGALELDLKLGHVAVDIRGDGLILGEYTGD